LIAGRAAPQCLASWASTMSNPTLRVASGTVEPAELQYATGAKLLAVSAQKFGKRVDAGASAADFVRVAAPGSFDATSHPLAVSAAIGDLSHITDVRHRS
jgi:hypothetical protein